VAVQAGDLPSARARFEQSLGIRQKLAQENPTSAEAQRDLGVSLSRLGDVAVQAGDLPSARGPVRAELGHPPEARPGSNPTSAEAQRDLSISLFKLGGVAVLTGDLPSAKARLEECVSILKKLAQRGAITPSDRQLLDQLERILQSLP
jgi:hypothetical protein